jgi:hypothetical protein
MKLTDEQLEAIDKAIMADKPLGREICWHDVSRKASDMLVQIAITTYQQMTCEHVYGEHPQFGLQECEICEFQPPEEHYDPSYPN